MFNSSIENLLQEIYFNKSDMILSSSLNEDYLSSSFKFDEFDTGLKSTQQIKLDYSKFENHTFFNSAVAKLNVAFEKIINKFPYDGTKNDILNFYDDLNGFEKYVLDNFPYNFGFLDFKGTNYIAVNDFQGLNNFQGLNKTSEGKSVLSPGSGSFSIEFHFKPASSNSDEIIIQKKNSSENIGYSIYTDSGAAPSNCIINISIFSGSVSVDASAEIERDKFHQLSFVFDNSSEDFSKVFIYVNSILKSESENLNKINSIDISRFNFLIGSGSTFQNSLTTFSPTSALTGSLDEIRFFSKKITPEEIFANRDKNVFAEDNLKLYYKFNEPADISSNISDPIASICLDSSGNSLHSNLINFSILNRKQTTEDSTSLMTNEKRNFNKILFPGNSEIRSLNNSLFEYASEYDKFNPNLITKLVPKHYLIDGQLLDGFDNFASSINELKEQNTTPGKFEIGNVQLMVSMLYVLASFYDELKLYIDSFSLIDTVEYDALNDSPDVLLERQFRKFGLDYLNILDNKDFNKYFLGEYSVDGINFDNIPLKEIQLRMLRNIAINLKHILSSKGTIDSLKYFIRSIGIDPETSMKFIEYGSNDINLSELRENRKISDRMIRFQTGSYIESDYLVAERFESGNPTISGNSNDDNLLTSGSWSLEFCSKFYETDNESELNISSLVRFYTTGSSIPIDEGCILNLIADKDNETLTLLFNPKSTGSPTNNILNLTNVNIFDGERWVIGFGREVNYTDHPHSSSYFIKAGRLSNVDSIDIFQTSSFFYDKDDNVFCKSSSTHNSDGLFFVAGDGRSQNISQTDFVQASDNGLNSDSILRFSNFRFWTKPLTEEEFLEHTKNPFSVGDENFIFNSRFELNHSSSYEKLRSHLVHRWDEKKADINGEIKFQDTMKSGFDINGYGFDPGSKVLFPDVVYHTTLPLHIDESVGKDKIFISNKNKKTERKSDNRFEIQISLIDYLNEDIIRFLSSTKELETLLGNQDNLFLSKYEDLEFLKMIYFDRLEQKLNFKSYREVYNLISDSIDGFIGTLLPEKTKFKGINFTVQQHLLERYKIKYKVPNFYLNSLDSNKNQSNTTILIEQAIIGN